MRPFLWFSNTVGVVLLLVRSGKQIGNFCTRVIKPNGQNYIRGEVIQQVLEKGSEKNISKIAYLAPKG